jgi:hypothetical protein
MKTFSQTSDKFVFSVINMILFATIWISSVSALPQQQTSLGVGSFNNPIIVTQVRSMGAFLEEYYFKPPAIVSYSLDFFGGINSAQQLRSVFAELEHHPYLHHFLSPE